MAKIWQTDFTSFSGSSDTLYDLVGTQHLTVTSGTINKQTPLIGFNNRKGILNSANGNVQQYVLKDNAGAIDLTNARLTANYTTRSFVLWAYIQNMANTSYWEATNECSIWGSYNVGVRQDYGLSISNTATVNPSIVISNANTHLIEYPQVLSNNWHCFVILVHRTTPYTKLYIDKVLVGTSATAIAANTPTLGEVIGDTGGSNEGTFYLGEATVYDHILTSGEINTIYDTFLVDSIVGPAYYQTFSGTVYDLNNQPASGINIYAYHSGIGDVVSTTQTSGNGLYTLILPYSGTYNVVVDNSPYGGVRAIPVLATSGGVYFP